MLVFPFRNVRMTEDVEVTILMPCLNEAETLGTCISKARAFLRRSGCVGEVVIADNGSTDGSQSIAETNGARVISVAERGYGNALLKGIRAARGKYVIMGDSDDSYDFSRLDDFLDKLRAGVQLVMGNRFRGSILPGAMPILHRYLGNPVLTMIGRILFGSNCGDFHCGLRAFDREAILRLDLRSPGMEFASEMVVKASIANLLIGEVPITLSPDGRNRPPHLRSWRDGWRHLRFLLIFSPRSIFLYPGFALFVLGLLGMAWLIPHPRHVGNTVFDVHTLLYASLAVVIGFQSMTFWIFAKVYGMREGILPPDRGFNSLMSIVTLEAGLILGITLLLIGLGLAIYAFENWASQGFGALLAVETMRLIIPSSTGVLLGFQIIYSSFFLSILEIRGSAAPIDQVHNGSSINRLYKAIS
jgi:glycosyltransferase involved in cell wall biosynthesis